MFAPCFAAPYRRSRNLATDSRSPRLTPPQPTQVPRPPSHEASSPNRRALAPRRAASRAPRSRRRVRRRRCRPAATRPAAAIAIMARNRNLPRVFHRHDRTPIPSLCGSLTSCLLVSAAAADENHFRKAAAIAILANGETPFSRYRQESHRPWPSQPCRTIRNRRHKRH